MKNCHGCPESGIFIRFQSRLMLSKHRSVDKIRNSFLWHCFVKLSVRQCNGNIEQRYDNRDFKWVVDFGSFIGKYDFFFVE